MENKITLVDIRRHIARQTGFSEEKAGAFLQALFPTLIEGLKEERTVHMSGLGIWKLVSVEPRKSVNISTGEPIVIEGYDKVTFLPEPFLREQINEPFIGLETQAIGQDGTIEDWQAAPKSTRVGKNPMQRLDEQANEILALLADMNSTPENESTAPETLETLEPLEPAPSPEPVPEPEPEPASKPVEPVEPKPFRWWRVAIITMVVLLSMLVGAFLFLQHKIEQWADTLAPAEAVTEEVTGEDTLENLDTLDTLERLDTLDTLEDLEIPASPTERVYEEFIAEEIVAEGSRLAWIAKKYYGKKEMWVYLYEANKDRISNPAHLTTGMQLRIPVLPESLTNLDDPQAAQLARELHEQYLNQH